jgi:uncharacterized protein YbbC (DUF1343 family)/CubicO group peptidase (beta-lactamase class C family)
MLALGILLLVASTPRAAELPRASPKDVGMDADRLARIDEAVNAALQQGQLPGAVVVVARQGKVVWRKAYGLRSRQPAEEPMTVDTVFDLASLTKPLATAASVMTLVEQGKLRLTDRVAQHIPDFGANGKEAITVEQLLLHISGLEADNALADYADGPARALERIHQLKPLNEPGSRFRYSDVNFIVLGELVERLGSKPLDQYARQHIFDPLGLKDTGFRSDEELRKRAAPTEQRDGRWIRGEVHDPRAHKLGGVAGHAGLFSTADEVAVLAQAFLGQGEVGGKRILSSSLARRMTTAQAIPGGLRALGWDVQTSYSANRGDLFRAGSFGHTGFTGTSVWIDPPSQTLVVFLSNRVHPDGKGNVTRLRGQVATAAAAAIVAPPFPAAAAQTGARTVLTGVDVLERDGWGMLKGRKVGLVCNHTARDQAGQRTVDLLKRAEGVTLVALFSPEHGLGGSLVRNIADERDQATGLPVYSLYGPRRRPTAEQLKGIDTLVYDIQDAGCRFYTYITTLGYVLETAAEHKLAVVVLDRPNPIGGVAVEGPVLDKRLESFTGYHPLPVRHGMTVGELARLFNSERKIGARLEVVEMVGWRRADTWDRTGLVWINPSPNLRSLTAALLYPGVGLLETTNMSVGRGTDRPFEMIGAPWLDGRRLAEALAGSVPGVRFVPTRFTPASSTFAGKECGGMQIYLEDWSRFDSLRTGLAIASALRRFFPDQWETERYSRLLAHPPTLEALRRGDGADAIRSGWQKELEAFLTVRGRYLLYQ